VASEAMIQNFHTFKNLNSTIFLPDLSEDFETELVKCPISNIKNVKSDKDKSFANPRDFVIKARKEIQEKYKKDKEKEIELHEQQKKFFEPIVEKTEELIKPFKEKLINEASQADSSVYNNNNNNNLAENSFVKEYLDSKTDRSKAQFSVRFNPNSNAFTLGKDFLNFSDETITIKDNSNNASPKDFKTYKASAGLMELLTKKSPNLDICSMEDKNNYKEMLITTNALFRNFDPKSGNFTADKSEKWKLIRHKLLPNIFKTSPKDYV
jgi:hypothetical protein